MESPEEAAALYSSASASASDDCRGATTAFTKRKRTKRLRALSSTASGPLAGTTAEEEDTAHCLILLAMGPARECEDGVVKFSSRRFVEAAAADAKVGFYVYECRSCSKRFSSFQALGGHRASHRKPKPAADRAVVEDRIGTVSDPEPADVAAAGRSRVHECAICGAEFASGQALGGHMRRHRPVGPTAPEVKKERKSVLALDLNLPAPAEDPMAAAFAFADRRPLALVGCHY